MMEFDLLDDAEEILQPLCLCLNQDSSRVGVGHHKGYVIYRIHRRTAPVGTEETSSSSSAAASSFTGPSFYTTIEAVFPPRRGTQSSTPSTWDLHECAPSPHAVASTVGISRVRKVSSDHHDEVDNDTLLDALPHNPSLQHMGKPLENRESEENQVTLEGNSVNFNPVGNSATTMASTLLGQNFSRWTEQQKDAPLPTETGVGAMALLYKTQFVAAVGGGPYPVGPKNVVKIFLTGDMWADREICVPDPVEEIRLDHRLIIILTTKELRLHSFETELCIFSVPLWADTAPTTSRPSTSNSPLFSASVSLNSTRLQQLNLGTSVTAASVSAASTKRFVAPLAIDYSKKCIAFRSSMVGFSLVRYDAGVSLCNRVNAELLATVSVAHEHTLSSLAMDLNGDIRSSGSNSASGSMRWHIATCSERGTIIRVWRYYERRDELPCAVDTTTSSAPYSSEVAVKGTIVEEDSSRTLPGYFVRIREVRNASLPTPIFQMRFLGEAFLFCIAWNTLKVFFVGEQEPPKPYDISTKDPSKSAITQNCYSSLHHLSVVSAYFNSEWAACECPLPLTDVVFLPKWVNTTSGELRQHLLRGVGSSCRMTVDGNGVEREMSRVSTNPEIPTPVSLLNDIQVAQPTSQSSLVGTVPVRSKPQDFGGILRRYVLQMAPMVESAGRVARNYWGFGGESKDAVRSTENDVTNDYSQKRDYTTMTEIAQSVVVWWEQPTYWQVEYMTKSLSLPNNTTTITTTNNTTTTTTGTTTNTGEAFPNRTKCPRPTVLYCVTCDGSAISFEFNPVKGTIECSKAMAVSSLEE
ncbi:hypothetical protein MOQ_000978 [Trypanosoma cruzi marinkellei]|uniref:Uncharacterized protein n=1 Tax=Trypanosoma cruzi marinkellei TaxID=85056 RepID=K2MU64_TRYCR|nr:hypothetical protein MOQ_000978 [Trypanosoma cruzi marinkellei]